MRRGRYSNRELFNARGLCGRWSWRGCLAYTIGFAAKVPFTSTSVYTGPVATVLGNADTSLFVGILAGAIAYWVTTRTLDRSAEQHHIAAADGALERA